MGVRGRPGGYSQLWRQSCSQIEMSYCGGWELGLGLPDRKKESLSPWWQEGLDRQGLAPVLALLSLEGWLCSL